MLGTKGKFNKGYVRRSEVIQLIEQTGGGGGGDVSSVFGRTGSVTAQNNDYNAGQVSNTPAGNIASTNLQDAINELDSDLSGKENSTNKSVDSNLGNSDILYPSQKAVLTHVNNLLVDAGNF